MSEPRGGLLWVPEFTTREVLVAGQEWPLVIVEKWERNFIGELRFVDTRTYSEEQHCGRCGPLASVWHMDETS